MIVTPTCGIALPCGIDNAMCHTRDMTHDNFFFLQKKNIKK